LSCRCASARVTNAENAHISLCRPSASALRLLLFQNVTPGPREKRQRQGESPETPGGGDLHATEGVCPGPPSHTTPTRRRPFVYFVVLFTAGKSIAPRVPAIGLRARVVGIVWSLRRCRSARVAPGGPSLFLLRGKISFLTHIPAFQVRRGRGQGGGGAWPLNGIFVTRQERDILPPSSSYRFPRNVTPHYHAVTP